MRFLNSIYFHIYNAYYKDGNYTSDIPHLTAFGIVGTSQSVLLTSLFLVLNEEFFLIDIGKELFIGLLVSLILIFYLLLLHGKKYERIYEEQKGSGNDNIGFKVFSWVYVVLSFAAFFGYAIIYKT